MRKLLDLLCLFVGGLSILAGGSLLTAYWLGLTAGIDSRLLVGVVVGSALGTAIFMVPRRGRTWPAWGVMAVLVGGTFALGQTAERWRPYAEKWVSGRTAETELPATPPVVPVAENKGSSGGAEAKTEEAAPTGTYNVSVVYYEGCTQPPVPSTFTLNAFVDGRFMTLLEGSIASGSKSASFTRAASP